MPPLPRWTTFSPAPAKLTDKNLPDQTGKVFIVTGATGGLGMHLANILHQHNAKVYLAARSPTKAEQSIAQIKANNPNSKGQVIFLKLQLDDLTTIKASAEEFLAKESRLDVLWNNAGVMVPPADAKTVQGYELQLGINNVGHFLFTRFLTPILIKTAASAPQNSVRIVWVSSSAADGAPKPAIDFSNMDYAKDEGMWTKYSRSKAGNVLHSVEFAKRYGNSGVISMALNPGNFVTDLQNNMPKFQLMLFRLISHDPINGAYTQLYAGLSSDITKQNNGGWVSPFGKIEPVRDDMAHSDVAQKYWDWSEEQVRPYV